MGYGAGVALVYAESTTASLPTLHHRSATQVTQRHLRNVRQMVTGAGAGSCIDLVAHAEDLARSFYGGLADGQLALMRQTLMRCADGPVQAEAGPETCC